MNTEPPDLDLTLKRFFTSISSLNRFDQMEVRPLLPGSPSPGRDLCVVGTYVRCVACVESALKLNGHGDWQAVAILARTVFELAVDIKLLSVIPDSADKMVAHANLDRLRAAKNFIAHPKGDPTANPVVRRLQEFVEANADLIDAECKRLWPGVKRTGLRHWANRNLRQRVELLKGEAEELHSHTYAMLSYHVHCGITPILNVESATLRHAAISASAVILRSYTLVMDAVIEEFHIAAKAPKVKAKMDFARLMAFTDSPEQAARLQIALLSGLENDEG